MWIGGAVGAAMYKYRSEESPCYLAAAVKTIVTIMFLFLPAKETANQTNGSSSIPGDPHRTEMIKDSARTCQAIDMGQVGRGIRSLKVARTV